MKSTNPLLRDSIIDNASDFAIVEKPMTVGGTIVKLLFLTVFLFLGAAAALYQLTLKHFDFYSLMVFGAFIVGLVTCLIISFKQNTAPYLSPVYAFCQGIVLFAISVYAEQFVKGSVSQAIFLTFIVLLVMAFLYKLKIIRATEKLRSVLILSSVAILVFYLIAFVMQLFGHGIAFFDPSTAYFYSPMAIIVNVLIALVAAFYLILDFDFIEKGAQRMLPSLYEWYGAFGLLATILWLYIEILKLLLRRER